MTTVEALKATLNWIDNVPQDTPLPAMPGFDRDWVDSLLKDQLEGWPELSYEEALDMALEWVHAVPADIRATLPDFNLP